MSNTSKTKMLKKGAYIAGNRNINPAPTKKVENPKKEKKVNVEEEKNKEAKARAAARRTKKLLSEKIPKKEKEALFDDNIRTILLLSYGTFVAVNGTKEKKVVKRDEHHKIISTSTETVPNELHGRAAIAFALSEYSFDKDGIQMLADGPTYCWVKVRVDKLDEATALLKPMGRIVITKHTKSTEKKVNDKTPTNNTTEAKKTAKTARKDNNKHKAEMRPYYAAWYKGGVSARIKKYNKTLAEKIEAWIAERRKALAEHAIKDVAYRAKHRQLTSMEMKANKRARKAAKALATQERRREREKKAMEKNATMKQKRAQNASKHAKKATEQKLNLKQAALHYGTTCKEA